MLIAVLGRLQPLLFLIWLATLVTCSMANDVQSSDEVGSHSVTPTYTAVAATPTPEKQINETNTLVGEIMTILKSLQKVIAIIVYGC